MTVFAAVQTSVIGMGNFFPDCLALFTNSSTATAPLFRLRDELKAQAAELVTLQTRLKDSQLNLNEFQTSTLPTQYELTKTIHEKNLLVEQVKYLEEEVQKKTRDDRAFRAESSGKIHELEVALSQATTQAEEAARQLATVKVKRSSFALLLPR